MKGNIALYNLSTYYLYCYICSNEICPTLYLYSLIARSSRHRDNQVAQQTGSTRYITGNFI